MFTVCVLAFLGNFRHAASYDSLASSLIPFQIWRGEGIFLDTWAPHLPPEVGYSLTPSFDREHWVSVYSLVTPLLVTPLYAPAAVFDGFTPLHPRLGGLLRTGMEKLAAAILAAMAVVALDALLCLVASPGAALISSLAYALASPTWSTSAQSLSGQATSNLLLCLALLPLARRQQQTPGGWAWLGLLAGLLTANRPQNLFLSLALAGIAWHRGHLRAWPFALAAGAVAIALAAYNLTFFSTVVGGYLDSGMVYANEGSFPTPNLANLAASLVSNRGLLVFCPFLLLLLRARRPEPFSVVEIGALLTAATAILVHASGYRFWHGGYCYGPRYAIDLLPVAFLLFAPALDAIRSRAGRTLVGVLLCWGLLVQLIGVFNFPGGNAGNLERFGVWNLARSAPVIAWFSGPQTPTHLPAHYNPLAARRPLRDEERRVEVRFINPPSSQASRNQPMPLTVEVRNQSTAAWSSLGGSFGIHAVRLALSWYSLSGTGRTLFERQDHWLDLYLPPGGATRRTLLAIAPPFPGHWQIEVEPLQVGYPNSPTFSELGGGTPVAARVRVRRPEPGAGSAAIEIGNSAPDRLGLPTIAGASVTLTDPIDEPTKLARRTGELEANALDASLREMETRELLGRLLALAAAPPREAGTTAAMQVAEVARLRGELESLAQFHHTVLKSQSWRLLQAIRRPFGRAWSEDSIEEPVLPHELDRLRQQVGRLNHFRHALLASRGWRSLERVRRLLGRGW